MIYFCTCSDSDDGSTSSLLPGEVIHDFVSISMMSKQAKMADDLQTTFWNAFSWIRMIEWKKKKNEKHNDDWMSIKIWLENNS